MRLIDYTGHQFGRLTITGRDKSAKGVKWLARCSCGNITSVHARALRSCFTRSCGCLRKEVSAARKTSHGMTGSPGYGIWSNMRRRCFDHKTQDFKDYGGRGITVCDRWLGRNGFANFIADMGSPPPGMTLDRRNVNGDYEPGNCRWATQRTQQNNRRNNVRLPFRGRAMTIREIFEEAEPPVNFETFRLRIKRGWDLQRAVSSCSSQRK